MTRIALATAFAAAVLLTVACTPAVPDTSTADAALAGGGESGPITPVANRPVMIGAAQRNGPACEAEVELATPEGGTTTTVLFAPESGPAKAVLPAGARVRVCDRRVEGYVGIIFPGDGQSLDSCGANRRVRFPREYQGPCRSGWIASGALSAS